MLERLSARVIAILVGAALLLALIAFALHQWRNARENAARARLSASQAGAVAESAKDAIGAVGAVSGRSGAADELTRKNEEEIRHAKGADAAVDPAVRDAGLRSLCARPQYFGHPKCVQLASPAGVEKPGPAGPAPGR